MGSVVVSRPDLFPAGTTVNAYPAAAQTPPGQTPQSGTPSGSSAGSAVVPASGVIAIGSLIDDMTYILYAGSPDRYLRVFAQKARQAPGQPAGAIATTTGQAGRHIVATAGVQALTSGTLEVATVSLVKGDIISGATWLAGGLAVTLTGRWYGLWAPGVGGARLALTADDATVWAANTLLPLLFTAPYKVPSDGDYYVGICEVAATPTTIRGPATPSTLAGTLPPVAHGTANAGLTNAASAPATLGAITADANNPFGWVF